MRSATTIFHLGATTDTSADAETCDANNHRDALAFLSRSRATRIVVASSCGVYGDAPGPVWTEATPHAPLTHYAASKSALEAGLADLARQRIVVCLRLSCVYGPGEAGKGRMASAIYHALAAHRDGGVPRWHSPARRRNYVHVDDVVSALLAAGEAEQSGVYNIASTELYTMGYWATLCGQVAGRMDDGCEWYDTPERWQAHQTISVEKAADELGWRPVVWSQHGIEDYWRHINTR